ncbi:hypothetical protein GH714_013240 [Hevea brasiliensis]|uniref:SOSEKI DIX-like domain-containing protein n=1 Tax=Hevea brasiliensis TaxID=3981 RepID=A0A6A6LIV9_HEVBR|nr:hypothetical protein GH714_013240 [Hevea brasiliensis]
MAVSSRARNAELLQVSRKFKDRDATPERTKLWVEPKTRNATERKVPVLYYLSRNGQLEHPHFMEVPLSSTEGLYLRDVISRLNILRGKSMATLYTWSSKRSYKNGFVWHDLGKNDFIYTVHGHEYVLKGSELLDPSINPKKSLLLETTSSSRSLKPLEIHKSSSGEDSYFPVITRRRNQSWSSIDLNKVYRTEPFSESTQKLAADASTQTDAKRRRRRPGKQEEEIEELKIEKRPELEVNQEEIEISPPTSDSSPETLESLMKADGQLILSTGSGDEESLNRTVENCGRMKASTVLMQLISCGSISFRDCGATAAKEQGFSLIRHYKGRLPRGGGNPEGTTKDLMNFGGARLEDKEYFSGSLIDTKKEEVPALKKSNSYSADRSSQLLQLGGKEEEGARTKCIPRKPKATPTPTPTKKESNISDISSQLGSKRFEIQQVENETK